jgi:peptidyl-prolyl cis-trans isomerase C
MLMKSRVLMMGAASVLALTACTKKDPNAVPATPVTANASSDSVAARVNGIPIYKGTVDLMVKERTAQGQPDSPELRKALIENLSMQTLVAAEATKKGLDKSPDTVRQLDIVTKSLLANAFIQDYLKNTQVSDADIKAEYDQMNVKIGKQEFKARHILVDTEAEANDIIAKLKKDIKAFPALAKEKSKDGGSKVNGGDLGWFNPVNMVPEFGAAVRALGKGELTQTPVKSQYGYHVIVLDDVRPLVPPPFEPVKEQIKQQLIRTKLKAFLDDMKAKAKIDIEGMPAAPVAPMAPAAPAIK